MTAAGAIAAEVRGGRRRASHVLEETLARIEARDDSVHAFTTRLDGRARRDALAIDAALAAGRDPGPLAGVPFGVKNLFDVEGVITTAGARIHAERPPATRDAPLVSRLRAAGAVLVGALNMDAYAYGFTTENTHFGATHNPHDLARTAGGSSGGSGAAVAAGMVPFALGSDTNGSIRVPASFCGIFGLRPTFGRLPREGTLPFVHDLDVLGPLATSATDLALVYDAMLGEASDATPARRLLPACGEGIEGLRIAVAGGYFAGPLSPEVRHAVALAAEALEAARRIEIPEAGRARAAAFVLTAATAGGLYLADLRERPDQFEPLSRDRLCAGALVPASWVDDARRFGRWYHAAMRQVFESVDAILAPATPSPAFPLGTERITIDGVTLAARADAGMYTQPISFAGVPVAAVPIGDSAAPPSQLPCAIQIIAAPWREDVCIRVAAALERRGVARARVLT